MLFKTNFPAPNISQVLANPPRLGALTISRVNYEILEIRNLCLKKWSNKMLQNLPLFSELVNPHIRFSLMYALINRAFLFRPVTYKENGIIFYYFYLSIREATIIKSG